MNPLPPPRWHDLTALAVLLLSAALLSQPTTLGGGWATWLDNPAHVAELKSLARGEAWCTEGFCGFPVHLLHAPVPYALLARAVALGAPIAWVYGGALLAGFLAAPLAVYAVARRRVPPASALLPAWLLLVHPNALADFGSALGGMWPFHLACGALILLIDAVARPGPRRFRDVLWMGLLAGAIGNLHWMVLSATVLLAIASLAFRPRAAQAEPSTLPADVAAAGLGACLSAPHWVPTILGRAGIIYRQQSIEGIDVLFRLLLPTDSNALWRGTGFISDTGGYYDVVPSLGLVGLGLWGAWRGRADRTVALASRWALVILALLVFVTPSARIPALGPLSWRFVWFVHLGLAVSATALPALPRRLVPFGALGLVLSTFLWRRPLTAETPTPAALADVEALWAWLRAHRAEIPGRVYLQSTMGTRPEDALRRSHILARTASETGVETVGAWYGITNFATGVWTPGEFGRLFRTAISASTMDTILYRMSLANCSHLVTSAGGVSSIIDSTEELDQVARFGRFVVFERDSTEGWATVADEGSVQVTARAPGAMTLEVTTEGPTSILVREAWHPFWHIDGGATLTATEDGLMSVAVARSGTIHLTYQASSIFGSGTPAGRPAEGTNTSR